VASLLSRPGSKKRRGSNASRSTVGTNGSSRGGSRPASRATAGSLTERSDQNEENGPTSELVTHTYRVSHLDKFHLPETFPQNIADIIRVNSTKTELHDMNCPRLTQHLKISPIVRENGPIVRRREAKERARLAALEEERKRREWAAIPKRYKGFFASVTRRKYGKWIVMSLYRMPKKPTILMIKGFCPIECVSIFHFLDLKLLGKMFGVKVPPIMWTDLTIKQVLQSTARQLALKEGDDRLAILITHPISSGPATQLGPHKSCIGFEKRRSVMKERRRVLPATDPVIPNIPLYEDRQYSSNVPKIGVKSRKKRRLYTGDTPNNNLSHRRDIGKEGLRVTQRGKKIGHAYGIYTLYIMSEMNEGPISSFEEMEEEIANKKYANQVIPPHLAPNFKIKIEIYFPTNPTYSARQNGGGMDFGEGVSSAPVVLKLVLNRRDLCRLVPDKYLLRYCLRIGHGFSYDHASEEEVFEMELSWTKMMNYLLGKCRWRRGHGPGSLDLDVFSDDGEEQHTDKDQPTNLVDRQQSLVNRVDSWAYQYDSVLEREEYLKKIEKAVQLTNTYAIDISSSELLQNPEKMITPLPPMKGPPLPPVTQDQVVDAFAEDYVGDDVDFSSITEDPKKVVVEEEVKEELIVEEIVNEIDEEREREKLLDKSNELVLSLPLCMFNKTCRIYSDVVRRPNVFLQVMIWQQGNELGVVAFDPELNDVYFVQPSAHQQKILCDELEPAGVTELSINMTVFAMSLMYEEKEYDLETGEEIDVSLRVVENNNDEEDASLFGDNNDSVKDDDVDSKEDGKSVKQEQPVANSEIPKTRVQGFLKIAAEAPLDDEEGEFVGEIEEPDFGHKEEEEVEEKEAEQVDHGNDNGVDDVDFDDWG